MEQCSEISSWESRKKEDKAKGIFQELIFGTPLCEFRPTDSIRIVNASIRSRGSNPVDVGSMKLCQLQQDQHLKHWKELKGRLLQPWLGLGFWAYSVDRPLSPSWWRLWGSGTSYGCLGQGVFVCPMMTIAASSAATRCWEKMKSNTKKFGCRKDPKNRSWRSPCLPTNPIFAEKLEISPHLGLEVENDHDSVDVRLGSLEDAVTPEPAPFSSAFAERFTLDWTTEKTSIRCRSH
ncbi:Protein of unknown function [Gryllus bimaculatus]|nr:Protein of unknown function [Gryllus bimaculatus]